MNVASLELCKELYELSGWEDEKILRDGYDYAGIFRTDIMVIENGIPAYDLGYLLRKLPNSLSDDVGVVRHFSLRTRKRTNEKQALWKAAYGKLYQAKADTPEDAACKLAIELFKQGVLQK